MPGPWMHRRIPDRHYARRVDAIVVMIGVKPIHDAAISPAGRATRRWRDKSDTSTVRILLANRGQDGQLIGHRFT